MNLFQIYKEKLANYNDTARSRVGSFENAEHKPGGGDVKVAAMIACKGVPSIERAHFDTLYSQT